MAIFKHGDLVVIAEGGDTPAIIALGIEERFIAVFWDGNMFHTRKIGWGIRHATIDDIIRYASTYDVLIQKGKDLEAG